MAGVLFQSPSPTVAPVSPGSSIVDWITAVATAAAVLVALWLAVRDGRRRREDEEKRAFAQARLVRVRLSNWSMGQLPVDVAGMLSVTGYRFEANIHNASDRPITGVVLALWVGELSGQPLATKEADVILASSDETLVIEETPYRHDAPIAVRVRWEDPDGRKWLIDLHEQDRLQPVLFTGQAPRQFQLTQAERHRLFGR